MKYIFIDEIKKEDSDFAFYGLVLVVIDNASYAKFKAGFYNIFEKLGWDKKIELKGRYSFSKKGDKNISIDDRLDFVGNLFDLSKSGGGKYASAQIFYSMKYFDKKETEMDKYSFLLKKILNKLPKANKKDNKNGKNNIVFFIDNNHELDLHTLSTMIGEVLDARGYKLVERIISVDSDNYTPGIIFVDHIAYFINNFLNLSEFNEKDSVVKDYKNLVEKLMNDAISESELKKLKTYLNNRKKEKTTLKKLRLLKKMEFIK